MTKRKAMPLIDLTEVLGRPVRVKVDGDAKTMMPFEAEVEQCAGRALRGNIAACGRFLRYCMREGIFAPQAPIDDHQYRIYVPNDWNRDEFHAMYDRYGPPPWPGKRDGLTPTGREERRLEAKERARQKAASKRAANGG